MSDVEQFSSLVADIYDTALEPKAWPRVLEKSAGCGRLLFECFLTGHSVRPGPGPLFMGRQCALVQLYLDKYIAINPFFPAIAFGEVGRVGVQSDIIPFDEFHATRFFREWAKPQGYVDCLYCLLEKSETGCAMITIRRDARHGLADDEACRRMGLVVPHVRRAVLISRALEHSPAATVTLTDMLDRMSAAIFLIGRERRIVHVNQAGDEMLRHMAFCSGATASWLRPIPELARRFPRHWRPKRRIVLQSR